MSEPTPRVSIGLPVFNGERYLEETLQSILGQTFGDLEIVISDNGSTDRTAEICRAFATQDRRVHYQRSERNRGGAWNHNRVFALSRGEYFKWAAHDDLLAPEFLERCVRVLDAVPAYALCTSRAAFVDERGAAERQSDASLDLESPQPHVRFREYVCKNHWALQLYGVARADALRRVPPLGGYIGADRILLAELVLLGPFHEIPEDLLFYRQHSRSSTSVFPDFRTRMAWWNPERAGAILIFPVWRRLREYLMTIHRVALTPAQRLGCYAALGQWLVGSRWMSGRWRLLARDLEVVAQRVIARESLALRRALRGHESFR